MISKFITRKNTNPQIGDIGFQNYTPSVFPVDNINTLPFNIDQTLSDENTNDIRFRDILFNDLRNLPQDFRTSLGQTKDALIKDFGGLTSGITSVLDKTKSGIGKGFDLGKAAIGGIASLVTGIPGIGLLLNAFGPMTEEEKAMRDFYGSEFGLTNTGQVASGIMQGYNPVSMFGGPGLSKSIDKRISKIQKTLQKKKSDTLQKRLQALEALRQKEEQARERDRAARARSANAAVYANLDRRTGGKGFGDAGGFSTARAGKEGAFGTFDGSRGRKDFFKGGLAGLL